MSAFLNCPACDTTFGFWQEDGEAGPSEHWKCPDCSEKMPPSLIKACGDTFAYVLKLRTGELIHFESAVIYGQFARLTIREPRRIEGLEECPFTRGIDVRLSDIVWCADAPYGS